MILDTTSSSMIVLLLCTIVREKYILLTIVLIVVLLLRFIKSIAKITTAKSPEYFCSTTVASVLSCSLSKSDSRGHRAHRAQHPFDHTMYHVVSELYYILVEVCTCYTSRSMY